MIALLESVWGRWIILTLLAVVTAGWGYVMGLEHGADQHADLIAQVAVKGAVQETQTKATIKQQQLITQQVEASYVQGSDSLRSVYGPGRVREQPHTGGRKLPAVPQAPGKPDATPANAGPGAARVEAVEADCDALRSDAAVTTRQLLFLQSWVRQQGGPESDTNAKTD